MRHYSYLFSGLLALLSGSAQAANFLVNSVVDAVDLSPGDGLCAASGGSCTLRAAIMETNALAGADSITLPGGQTYLLTIAGRNESAGATGDLDISDSLSLSSAPGTRSIIDANLIDRVLDINGFSLDVSLDRLTIRNGSVFDSEGGGIKATTTAGNFSTLSIRDCIIENNSALGAGGILTVFDTTIMDSIVRNNQSSLNFNNTTTSPGISAARRQLDIVRTAIYGNTVPMATVSIVGGIGITDGMLTLRSSTVSGNSHRGIRAVNTRVELNNVTVQANGTGGISLLHTLDNTLMMRNSIVANNSGDDCAFLTVIPAVTTLDVIGPNITSDNTCGLSGAGGSSFNTDPLLGPLADGGYFSPVHLPLTGSPAIDAGSTLALGSTPDACEFLDQRRAMRSIDGDIDGMGACDIGAVEANPDLIFADGYES